MNIDELTLGQIKEMQRLVGLSSSKDEDLNDQIGEYVIIRTYSAGVWFGILERKSGNEVYLTEARRMCQWKVAKGISLSGVALSGIIHDDSKICAPVSRVWLEAIEIVSLTDVAIDALKSAKESEVE